MEILKPSDFFFANTQDLYALYFGGGRRASISDLHPAGSRAASAAAATSAWGQSQLLGGGGLGGSGSTSADPPSSWVSFTIGVSAGISATLVTVQFFHLI